MESKDTWRPPDYCIEKRLSHEISRETGSAGSVMINNLPKQLTRFAGRKKEAAQVKALLVDAIWSVTLGIGAMWFGILLGAAGLTLFLRRQAGWA